MPDPIVLPNFADIEDELRCDCGPEDTCTVCVGDAVPSTPTCDLENPEYCDACQ